MDNTTFLGEQWKYYFHPPDYLSENAMAITGAGHSFQAHSSRVVNRCYPSCAFVLSLSGGASIDFRGRRAELARYDCFFIPELEKHTYGADAGRIWDSYWVSFKACDSVVAIWESLLPTVKNIKDPRLLSCFSQISRIYHENPPHEAYTAILFNMMAILRSPQKDAPVAPALKSIEDAHKYIIDNLEKKISVDDISERANLSPTHFSRLFKKRYGMSVAEYVISRKIAKAQLLLATTSEPIKTISRKTGFSCQLYFSRLFKKKLRITPTQFRKYYNTPPNLDQI